MLISEEQSKGLVDAITCYSRDKKEFIRLYRTGSIFKITYSVTDNWIRVDYSTRRGNSFITFNGFTKELVAKLIAQAKQK